MKLLMKAMLFSTLMAFVLGCQNAKEESTTSSEPTEPKTDKEKISYAIGVNMAQSIGNIIDEIDLAMLQKGMSDRVQGKELLVPDEEARHLLQAFSQKVMAKEQEEIAKTAQKNLEEGQAYLEENKTREGVNVTQSGLQYKVLKEGEGKSPDESDRIMVHYKGTKLDGTVFDSSYERGQPATFQANQVIEGWTEGVQLMKEGGKYKLFIPAGLAYGEAGAGQQIGPNEVLIFEVELLEVVYDQPVDSQVQEDQN